MPSRAYIASFGFKGPDQQKKAGVLSGGERNRLNLALTLKMGGNMLLLDEPTNDLDVETLQSLEDALLEFPGCAVITSHDRWFLDRTATHILAWEGDDEDEGKWFWFEGNFAVLRGEQGRAARRRRRPGRTGSRTAGSPATDRPCGAGPAAAAQQPTQVRATGRASSRAGGDRAGRSARRCRSRRRRAGPARPRPRASWPSACRTRVPTWERSKAIVAPSGSCSSSALEDSQEASTRSPAWSARQAPPAGPGSGAARPGSAARRRFDTARAPGCRQLRERRLSGCPRPGWPR